MEEYSGHEYYPELIALNTGRNALLYLLKTLNITKIYIPFYLCDSIRIVCENNKIDLEQYNINKELLPDFDKQLRNNEYIYIVNYFGVINNLKALELKKEFGNIIFDNAQAFFQEPIFSIPTIYSCRKFFGVPDGAYLATNTIIKENLDIDISKDRMTHILGRYEINANEFYKDFKENDNSFKSVPLKRMSLLTKNLLKMIDYNQVKKTRNRNFMILDKIFRDNNKFGICCGEGPYAYPLYCENGMAIKKRLVNKKIYIPTLWPNVLNLENCPLEIDYANNILPLPVDQRYDEKDIQYIADAIINYL